MKARYYSDLATNFKNEPRKFWKNVSFLSNSTKLPACVNLPFSANILFLFSFCVTNMTSSSVSPLSYLSIPTKSSFSFQPVAATDILRLISQLSVRKSSGFDGLSARVIKCFSVYLASPLSIIINKSLSDSIVPVLWKSAIITPVVKKKGDFSMNNF